MTGEFDRHLHPVRANEARESGQSTVDMEAALVDRFRDEVAEGLAARARADEELGRPPMSAEDRHAYSWHLIGQGLDAYATEALAEGRPPLDRLAEQRIAHSVQSVLFGVGGFQPYLDDPEIENINANGCDRVFVRYADGRREQVAPVAASDAELVELVRTVAGRAGIEERRFDRGSPRLSAQLPDGSRLFAVMAVSQRPSVSIRRHCHRTVGLEDLERLGAVDAGLRAFFRSTVLGRKNVLICGGTAIGKTTFLRALASEIPHGERLVTIEDSLELGLDRDPRHPDAIALQAREPNVEGEGEVGQAELVRWALRMSPDRVIVGEIRGPEVVPMANAMTQGNDGSMATIHASSSRGAFMKLASYAVQGPERLPLEATNMLVAAALDFVVHLSIDVHGRRVVASVREVVDAEGTQVVSNEVFRPGPDGRAIPGVPPRASTLDELLAAGFDPRYLDHPEGWWAQ